MELSRRAALKGLLAGGRAYAQTVRLPANMDAFLAGGMDASAVATIVRKYFGVFPLAQGPMLAVPQAPITRTYRTFMASSPELRRPLSKAKIAWNTGVGVTHCDAKVVLALSEYLNAMLFRQIRETYGDSYASYLCPLVRSGGEKLCRINREPPLEH